MAVIGQELFWKMFGDGQATDIGRYQYAGPNDRRVLLALARSFRPRVVVEIGVQAGITAALLLRECAWIERYYGVDIPADGKARLEQQQSEVPPMAGLLARKDRRFTALVSDLGSRDPEVRALDLADLVYIDGSHAAQDVAADTELARHLTRDGGVICWHDYNNSTVPGVAQVIDSLNAAGGDRIILVDGTWVCFEIRSCERMYA